MNNPPSTRRVPRNRFGWSRSDYRLAGAAGLAASVYGIGECLLAYRSPFNMAGLMVLIALCFTSLMAYRFNTFKAR